jgi:hypothetical protein
MKPVDRSEILGLGEYEQIRERFRSRVIEDKRARRVALGGHMTVLFENHDTVLFQIQEMLRTERISADKAVQHEIETYNQLVPGEDELSATVFIEYPDTEERDRMLAALAGVERCFYVTTGEERLPAQGEKRGERTDRTTAVQYVKFPLSAAARRAIESGEGTLRLGVDHPAYKVEVDLSKATRESLAADLAG